MILEIPRTPVEELLKEDLEESSKKLKDKVLFARGQQQKRFEGN
jgi:predicted ATPase with chaperone activity